MLKKLVLLSIGVVVLLLIPGGPFGRSVGNSTIAPALDASPTGSSVPPAAAMIPTLVSGTAGPIAPPTAAASIGIATFASAQDIPASFWGVNVAAAQKFTSAAASSIAATPANYIRFPGGILGEEYNYTSGILTSVHGGGTSTAATSIQAFITACQSIGCHAILQLPAEIDQPQTAAYYVSYVVNTLHFKPAYWEIGNAVQGWSHFDTPWSKWKSSSGKPIDALLFAEELGKYVSAIRAVVPRAAIIALGMALGRPNNDRDYITEVASLDGKNISGISVHSYVNGGAPTNPTWADLLSNLNGKYSLASGVTAARGYLQTGCPKCALNVFVTEANAAEVASYSRLLPTFAATVYVAADTVQALNLRVTNLDWFAFNSHYLGAWEQGKTYEQQYTLMTQMMTHLGTKTLTTTVSGPSMFYAAATYGASGLALLLVNANVTQAVSLNLANAGILSGALVHEQQWKNGSAGPTNSSFNRAGSLRIPALSITILTVGVRGLAGASGHPPSPTGVDHPPAPPSKVNAPSQRTFLPTADSTDASLVLPGWD